MAAKIIDTASRIQADNRLQPRALRLISAARVALGWEPGQQLQARWVDSERGEIVEVSPLREPIGDGWVECGLRRNGGARGAEALYINCRALLREIHAVHPLTAEPLHAEVDEDTLRVFVRQAITPEVYGLRVWGDRRQKKAPMRGKRHEVHLDLMLYNDTLTALEAEARALGMPLRYYLRQIIEQREPLALKHSEDCDTHQERAHIMKKANQAGHTLTVEELTERGLPLCWNREWLLARVAEGMSYVDMARQFGFTHDIYAYWGRKAGVRRK